MLQQNEYSIAVAVREMRAMLEDEGLSGNIVFVAPTPVEDDDKIQAAFIVRPASKWPLVGGWQGRWGNDILQNNIAIRQQEN